LKIFIIGDWHSSLHEQSCSDAFERLGHQVVEFGWSSYFTYNNFFLNLFAKVQYKYILGPITKKVNRDILNQVVKEDPDLIFVYRGTHVYKKTFLKIKSKLKNVKIVSYNNDDPFSDHYPKWMWDNYLDSVPVCDISYAYRKRNLTDLKQIGAKRVKLLRSWYISETHRPINLSKKCFEKYGCDIVFIGHYEDDGRLECLEKIVLQGWKLRIFGPGYEWNRVLKKSNVLKDIAPVDLVWEDEYNLALNGAKIALCFFSKINNDTYTRRCFEIPASKTTLVSEFSSDLASLYVEDQEAIFFRDCDEMSVKINYLLSNPEVCEAVAISGMNRARNSGYDVDSRMKDIIEDFNQLN
jgi:spore maturation protein CgeB